MNSLPIPLFLTSSKARSLNAKVHQKTGCLVFLKVPDHIISANIPKSASDCFAYNIIGLYKLYKDYSLGFIEKIFMNCMLPSQKYCKAAKLEDALNQLYKDRTACKNHYDFIVNSARHVITHGIYSISESVDTIGYTDPKEKELQYMFKRNIGKSYPTTDEDWEKLATKVCEDANNLYNWIDTWADLWNEDDPNWNTMFGSFYDGITFDGGKHCSIIKDKIYDEKRNLMPFSAEAKGNSYTDFAKGFTIQFLIDAVNYIARYFTNKESRSNSHKNKWRSNDPNRNIDVLYEEMNLYVIDQVRTALKDSDSRDGNYHDYYKTLYSAMNSYISALPTNNTKPIIGSHLGKRR